MARAADDGRAHVLDRFLQLDGGLPRFPLLIKLIPQPPIDRKAKPGMLAYIYIGSDSPRNHQNHTRRDLARRSSCIIQSKHFQIGQALDPSPPANLGRPLL